MADAVAEGMLVSRGGVPWGDETVLDVQALVLKARDGVFEIHGNSRDSDDVVWIGVVLDVDDHCVGAEGLNVWLRGLAMAGHRWWS